MAIITQPLYVMKSSLILSMSVMNYGRVGDSHQHKGIKRLKSIQPRLDHMRPLCNFNLVSPCPQERSHLQELSLSLRIETSQTSAPQVSFRQYNTELWTDLLKTTNQQGNERCLLGKSSAFFATQLSYRLEASRSASYPAVMRTMAAKEIRRDGVEVMCHRGKMMQRFSVDQLKSICCRPLLY
jgi:hypothetical protein